MENQFDEEYVNPDYDPDFNEKLKSFSYVSDFFKWLNADIVSKLDIIEVILKKGIVNKNEIKKLKKNEIEHSFFTYELFLRYMHEFERQMIIEVNLSEARKRIYNFFDNVEFELWDSKIKEYKKKFMLVGFEVDYLFSFLDLLEFSFVGIEHFFFLADIPDFNGSLNMDYKIKQVSDGVYYENIKKSLSKRFNAIKETPDLSERKKLLIDEIVESNVVMREMPHFEPNVKIFDIHNRVFSAQKYFKNHIKNCYDLISIINSQIKSSPIVTATINPELNPTFKLDAQLLNAIHEHCNNAIFVCTVENFVNHVEKADFSLLTIKTKSKVKLLIYMLSMSMGSVWYTTTAKSLNLQKSDCSGANVSDEKWKKEMKRIFSQ